MKQILKRDYDAYLTSTVITGLEELRKKGQAKIYVHKRTDAVKCLAVIEELQWEHPEAIFLEIELCQIH
jgi:rRNA-processing protein FCF1|tara:strand:- start:32 stop:238 length:207 start_codon:yes stop_codon:yes gene_type:complete